MLIIIIIILSAPDTSYLLDCHFDNKLFIRLPLVKKSFDMVAFKYYNCDLIVLKLLTFIACSPTGNLNLKLTLKSYRSSNWWQCSSPHHSAHCSSPWWKGKHHQPWLKSPSPERKGWQWTKGTCSGYPLRPLPFPYSTVSKETWSRHYCVFSNIIFTSVFVFFPL